MEPKLRKRSIFGKDETKLIYSLRLQKRLMITFKKQIGALQIVIKDITECMHVCNINKVPPKHRYYLSI